MFKYTIILYSILTSSLQAQTFQSTQQKTQLLELYSSQGCSSCPPAEHWVSQHISHPQLWKKFIPMVFHVDYWNYLGWKDPFSDKHYSQRQRNYHHQGAVRSVYTPAIIFDGSEWHGWYRGKNLPLTSKITGMLSAQLRNDKLSVQYQYDLPLQLNIALLGFGVTTDIESGENAGKLFTENFIVLKTKRVFSKNAKWNIPFTIDSKFNTQRYALAIWVNQSADLQPLQAVGGWIDP